jgi:putative oxidoreductase
MTQPGHETGYLPAIKTQACRDCVVDSSGQRAQGSVATQANTTSSSEHHLRAAGVAASAAVEKMIVWTVSVVLAAFFLIVGVSKLPGPSGTTGGLNPWSNATLLYLIARTVEIAGALMLLIPRCAWLGAVGLAAVMAGIVGNHLAHCDPAAAVVPLLLLALLGVIAHARRAEARN